jgi:hypothetical protein
LLNALRWAGVVASTGEMRNSQKNWSENINERDLLEIWAKIGTYKRRREDFKGTECEGVDWTYLAQQRNHWHVLVNTVRDFRFQSLGIS